MGTEARMAAAYGATLVLMAIALTTTSGCSDAAASGTSTTGVPDGFDPTCSLPDIECHDKGQPPALVGTYTGTGETVSTMSDLWAVGESADFVLEIATQEGDQLTGFIDIEFLTLEIEDAVIRGSDDRFTIFGLWDEDAEGCAGTMHGVITGRASEREAPTEASGMLALTFTEISGPTCTPEDLADEGTSATFSYTARRHDGPLPSWSECITTDSVMPDETCASYCAQSGKTCSTSCGVGGALHTALSCDSNIWGVESESCDAVISEAGDAAAECCCE